MNNLLILYSQIYKSNVHGVRYLEVRQFELGIVEFSTGTRFCPSKSWPRCQTDLTHFKGHVHMLIGPCFTWRKVDFYNVALCDSRSKMIYTLWCRILKLKITKVEIYFRTRSEILSTDDWVLNFVQDDRDIVL